jgi:hypothetical protein
MILGALSKFKIVQGMAGKVINGNADQLIQMAQEMGRDAVIDLVGGAGSPLGMAFSAFYRYVNMTNRDYNREKARIEREENRPMTAAERRKYNEMHRQWLRDNQWRFDWRSQPRRPAGTEAGGEWMPGRLDYMAELKNPVSRSKRQAGTRAVKAYIRRQRAMGNMNTRTIRTSWGDF